MYIVFVQYVVQGAGVVRHVARRDLRSSAGMHARIISNGNVHFGYWIAKPNVVILSDGMRIRGLTTRWRTACVLAVPDCISARRTVRQTLGY